MSEPQWLLDHLHDDPQARKLLTNERLDTIRRLAKLAKRIEELEAALKRIMEAADDVDDGMASGDWAARVAKEALAKVKR